MDGINYGVGVGIAVVIDDGICGVLVREMGSEHAYRSSDPMLLAAQRAVLTHVSIEGFAEVLEVAHTLAVTLRRCILTHFREPSNDARGESSSRIPKALCWGLPCDLEGDTTRCGSDIGDGDCPVVVVGFCGLKLGLERLSDVLVCSVDFPSCCAGFLLFELDDGFV